MYILKLLLLLFLLLFFLFFLNNFKNIYILKKEFKTTEGIYDEVTEEEYSRIVQDRINDNFVVDDDGSGYVDHGLDEYDDDFYESSDEEQYRSNYYYYFFFKKKNSIS